MGTGISINCSNCGASEEALLGVGEMYTTLERVIDLVSPVWRERVLAVLHEHDVEETDCGHTLFACPSCNTVHNRFWYRIVYDGGQVLESVFQCRRCRADLLPAAADISQYSCKRCGQRSLSAQEGILWD